MIEFFHINGLQENMVFLADCTSFWIYSFIQFIVRPPAWTENKNGKYDKGYMKTKRIEVFNLVWALVERLQCQIQTQSQYTITVHITKHKHKSKIQIPKVTSALVGMFQCWSWRHFQEGDRPKVHDGSSLEKITHIISQMRNTFSYNPFCCSNFFSLPDNLSVAPNFPILRSLKPWFTLPGALFAHHIDYQ